MELINDIFYFDIVENIPIYASGHAIHWKDKSASFDEQPTAFVQTKDFLIVLTGNKNVGFLIRKSQLLYQTATWLKLPRYVSRTGHNYEKNQIILISETIRDQRSWVLELNNFTEKEYPSRVKFVPGTDYVFEYQTPMPLFDALSGNKVIELLVPIKENDEPFFAPRILGSCNNLLWIRTRKNEIIGFGLKKGEVVKSFDPFKLAESKRVESNRINFGHDGNSDNFHIDLTEQRIVTFASGYYCEISLLDFSINVIDLNAVYNGEHLTILASRWCIERKWLYFIGHARKDNFDQHFGVFDTVSEKIIDIEKAKDKDEFFGQPPIFGDDVYGVLSTKKVLYLKPIK